MASLRVLWQMLVCVDQGAEKRHSFGQTLNAVGCATCMCLSLIALIKTEYWDRAGGGGNISYDW